MALFATRAARLAFLADRKVLSLEEERYVRLDIPAHEHVGLGVLGLPRRFFTWLSLRQFALSALVIYISLFMITNAPAYGKILLANIKSATEESESSSGFLAIASNVSQSSEIQDDGLMALSLTPTPYDNRINIPSLSINAPIVEPDLGVEALKAKDWPTLEDQIRGSLIKGIVHYPGTAKPGKKGNSFFTGHSSNVFWEFSDYNTVFALLPKIDVGADIYVNYEQKTYQYRVIEKKEVQPDDVSILKQGNDKILTLMTCTPVGTTLKRLTVTAELVES